MEASGAIIPSICSSMTRSNHHAGFSENPPSHAVKDIFTGFSKLRMAKDPNKNSEITKRMLKQVSGEFDLESIHTLKLNNIGITNLGCVGLCLGLERLDLSNNNIVRISPITGLINLTYLNLSANKISSLDGLQSLPNLMQLNLAGNLISSIGTLRVLSAFDKLIDLRLDDRINNLTNAVCRNVTYFTETLDLLPCLSILDGVHVQGDGSDLHTLCSDLDAMIKDISSLPVSCENESPEIPHFNEEFSSTKSGEENSEQIFNSDGHKLIESLFGDCQKLLSLLDDRLTAAEVRLKSTDVTVTNQTTTATC